MTRIHFHYCLLLSLLCFGFACGGGEKAAPAANVNTESAPQKKVLVVRLPAAPKSLDPVKQLDQISSIFVRNLYDTLVQYHYLKRPYQLEPSLITKMPEASADGMTYTFELRKDVRFIDDACFPGGKGRGLVTDDVLYSFKRFADANLNVNSYMLLQGAVEGMDAFHEQTKQLGKATDYSKLEISGFQKLDEHRFTMKFTRADPRILMIFAVASMSIVSREAVEHYKEEFERHPVGTGPFKVKTLARRGVTILEKNPNYHETYPTEGEPADTAAGLLKSAGKRLPLIDEVHMPLIEEGQPAMLRLLSGDVDWIINMDEDSVAKMTTKDENGFRLLPEHEKNMRLSSVDMLATDYISFNMKDPIVGKKKELRQAIAYLMDTPAFIKQVRNGRANPLKTIVPRQIAGSEVDVKSEHYTFNLALAKQKLAEAGYPEGKGLRPLTMEFAAADARRRRKYEFLRAQLAQAGIVLKANFQTATSFLQRIEGGNYELAFLAWGADYPDAENFYQLLYSKNVAPGPNHASYKNPEYDKLYEQIRFMAPGPERNTIFAQMNQIIHDDVPVAVLQSWIWVGLYQPWVSNLKAGVMDYVPAKYIDTDPAAKAKKAR